MFARCSHRLAAVLVASAALVAVAPLPASAAPALPDPGGAALDWTERELDDDDDGVLATSGFPDFGLTIDALLALAAGGRGDGEVAAASTDAVEADISSYVTSGDFGPDDRWAGALAKTLLLALVQGSDPTDFGGFDLEDELHARMQTTGGDAGRFSDHVESFQCDGQPCDFSNGFGQALAVIALARTGGGVPDPAVSFLLAQQCPAGGFRGDYSSGGGCTDDASATVDATGFALMALIATDPTCATRQSVTDAVAWLLDGQGNGGAFGGESGSNTNSTGLAAVAMRSLGEAGAADDAAAFIADLQLESGDDLGAIALNAAGEASAGDGIQEPERDGFRRATTQGVLAFGLPTYAEIGAAPIDPGAFTPCGDPPVGPPAPTAALSASTVPAGGTITVTGAGFLPGEQVQVILHSTPVVLATVTADTDGSVSTPVTIPADIEPGPHTIELMGVTSGRSVEVAVTIEGVEDPAALPATGRTAVPEAGVGAGLVALGGVLVLVARRRSRRLGAVGL
jgi:hypothetical protein